MPEHWRLLIWPSQLADPSQLMQKLADRTANFILTAGNGFSALNAEPGQTRLG